MSTMKNHLCSFLSRLALCGLAAPFILLSPALVRADAITTFAVSGTAQNTSGQTLGSCAAGATCDFSGTMQVDTTSGTLRSFAVRFPGLVPGDGPPTFNTAFGGGLVPEGGRLDITASNAPGIGEFLFFDFTTGHFPASLVGFTGGSIVGDSDMLNNYSITGGTITPVPEPSSLVLLASGMLVFGLTRRFGKKVGHPVSA